MATTNTDRPISPRHVTPAKSDADDKKPAKKEKVSPAKHFISAMFAQPKRAEKSTRDARMRAEVEAKFEKSIGNLVEAIGTNDEEDAHSAAIMIEIELQSLIGLNGEGGPSLIELQGESLLRATKAKKVEDLEDLNTSMEKIQSNNISPTLQKVLRHLSISVKSEILRSKLDTFAQQGVFFGGGNPPDMGALTEKQRLELPVLGKHASDIINNARHYSSSRSESISGTSFSHIGLDILAIQLGSGVVKNPVSSQSPVQNDENSNRPVEARKVKKNNANRLIANIFASPKRAEKKAREAERKAKLAEEQQASKAIHNLVSLVSQGNGDESTFRALILVDLALKSLQKRDGTFDPSEIQLRGDFLLKETASMKLSDLNALNASLEGFLSKPLPQRSGDLLKHLAVSVRSEILRCRLRQLEKEGAIYGESKTAEFGKLSVPHQREAVELSRLARELRMGVGGYVNARTGAISGVHFQIAELEKIESQLSNGVAAQLDNSRPTATATATATVTATLATTAAPETASALVDREVGNLIQALKNGDESEAHRANLMIDLALVPGFNPGPASTIARRRDFLVKATGSMNLPELNTLNDLLKSSLSKNLPAALGDMLKHLAALVKVEILYQSILEFDAATETDENEEFLDFQKLTQTQLNEIPQLLEIGADLKNSATVYLNLQEMLDVTRITSLFEGKAVQNPVSVTVLATSEVRKLLQALDNANESDIRSASFVINTMAVAESRGSKSDSSAIQGKWLLGATSSMQLDNLAELWKSVDSKLSKELDPTPKKVLTHLAFSVGAEILRRWEQELASLGVSWGKGGVPDFGKLPQAHLEQIHHLRELASDVCELAVEYSNSETDTIAGSNFSLQELNTMESQLASVLS